MSSTLAVTRCVTSFWLSPPPYRDYTVKQSYAQAVLLLLVPCKSGPALSDAFARLTAGRTVSTD